MTESTLFFIQERLKNFYSTYFGAVPNEKYINKAKGFSSYFLSFEQGPGLEIMQMPSVSGRGGHPANHYFGLAHFAISVGSPGEVDKLTARLEADGYKVMDGPRKTGDGSYESVILDPENNRVEITV